MSSELGNGAGKTALLAFHDFLRKKKSLINSFKNKTTVSIFFLDKDVDDFLRTKRRSIHIVYTEYYEQENYLFIHGNLCDAAACSASLAIASVKQRISNYDKWRMSAADNWREWVKLCFFSIVHKLHSEQYYSRQISQINNGTTNQIENTKHQLYLKSLQSKSGLSKTNFEMRFNQISVKIDKLYDQRKYDLVFKGKWYVHFLTDEIKKLTNTPNYVEQSIIHNLATSLDYNDTWTDHFKNPMRNLITIAGI